jgi:hypothetical protein
MGKCPFCEQQTGPAYATLQRYNRLLLDVARAAHKRIKRDCNEYCGATSEDDCGAWEECAALSRCREAGISLGDDGNG